MRHPGNDSQVKSVGSASGIYTPVKSQIPPQQGVLHQLPDGCIQISFLVFMQLFDRLAEGWSLLNLGDDVSQNCSFPACPLPVLPWR